ncbi:Cro/Cl family transcriptional regulator [Caloranaerobacter sp. TR13]|uniref:sugar-binding transcriptional regulator n=1 Tax=Caloranaerobacter sp. TR13 TaxID=1302151 RepID=UPI0006D3EB2C|nr:sugar-binding domain-containing protein [Caloranaerobacter sp. TR13]KPU26468.1 Cro/Cl family transcriptional regulator [Caloranaerobacter sp. TR13]
MKDIIELQRKIVPEMIEILEKRYNILRNIYYNQPIGRRTLANSLNIGERIIRTEVNILKKQGLLEIKSQGMNVTEEGKIIIEDLKDFIHRLKGLNGLEKKLEQKLNISNVIVVPGNYDEDNLILKDIGRASAKHLKQIIKSDSIIGITGGTTMAQLAEEMPNQKGENDILVLPARGGLGRNVEVQANNVAAKLAQKLGGHYKLLHVPDNIGKEALDALLQIPEIREIVDAIKNLDVLIFGIGRADVMAKRRQLSIEIIEELKMRGAVAEAFGHYFNTKGEKVWESNSVGLSLVDFENLKNVVGVACGVSKAEAIIAICSLKRDMTLIIDEGAARKILELVK